MGKGCWLWTGLVALVAASLARGEGRAVSAKGPERAWIQALAKEPWAHRADVRQVLEQATLVSQGVAEKFPCKPQQYYWLLDHPHRAVSAWRRLGAKCVSIVPREDGFFVWNDGQGSEVVWEIVQRGPGQHVWYAEGKVKPAPLVPAVPVKAVAVLRYQETAPAEGGGTVIEHQALLCAATDNKTAVMITRLLGPAAPRMAEQGLGQLQMFFGGLSWYLLRHPEQTPLLLQPEKE